MRYYPLILVNINQFLFSDASGYCNLIGISNQDMYMSISPFAKLFLSLYAEDDREFIIRLQFLDLDTFIQIYNTHIIEIIEELKRVAIKYNMNDEEIYNLYCVAARGICFCVDEKKPTPYESKYQNIRRFFEIDILVNILLNDEKIEELKKFQSLYPIKNYIINAIKN